MALKGFHHVAYRCNDSQETVDFYTKVLGLRYSAAHRVVSGHADHSETLHTFFELPEREAMIWDPNTPRWVQHIAFEVKTMEELHAWKQRLEQAGVVLETNRVADGVKVGKTITSVYFNDPSGHRLEICVSHGLDPDMLERDAWESLAKWNADLAAARVGKRKEQTSEAVQ